METNPTPAPRQRTRRADRYHHDSEPLQVTPAEPTTRQEAHAAPAPIQSAVPPASRAASAPLPHDRITPPARGAEGVPAYLRGTHGRAPLSEQTPARATRYAQQEVTGARQERPATPRSVPAAQPADTTVPAAPALPRWMTACIAALCFLCLSLMTAQALMSAYLTTQQQARDVAHDAVVSAHPLSYTQYIDYWAAEYGLQPAYVASIILNESSYRPNAESGVHARGLMQLMEGTARDVAKELNVSGYSFDLLWDPDVNVRFGCHYLRKLADMFGGDPVLVTAAYNAGYGNVRNWLASRETSPDGRTIPIEKIPFGDTKVYAGRVTKAYGIYDALYYHAFNPDADSTAAGAAAGV